jgi:anti-sigma factor RsiW
MDNEKTRDIDCGEALKLIASYVDSQSTEPDVKALEKHLESCRHCLDRVEFEKLLKRRLQGLKIDTTSMKPGSRARKMLEDL